MLIKAGHLCKKKVGTIAPRIYCKNTHSVLRFNIIFKFIYLIRFKTLFKKLYKAFPVKIKNITN